MLACLLFVAASAAFVPENSARVAEIAAMLPEKPETVDSFQYVCTDRNPAGIEKAVRQMKRAVEPFPNDLYLEFTRNGNRTHFQQWRQGFLRTLATLVLAEKAEWKGRFVPAIAARLEAICDWPSWVLPAHDGRKLANFRNTRLSVDLVSSDLARTLARVLASVGDVLPAATVGRVRGEVNRRVFEPYLKRPQEQWWFLGCNNWNAVCHCGCVIAALEMIEDRLTRARFIEGAERGMDVFLNFGFEPDGYCTEGMSYWNYGFGHFLGLTLAVRRATGGRVDFGAHPKALTAMRFVFADQLEKGVAPRFADGAGDPDEHVIARGLEVWPELKLEQAAGLPIRSVFPDGQVWVMRLPAGSPERFAFACKGGHNAEHHNHNDVGTYNVLLGGELIAGDVGGEIYTARTFSSRRYDSKVLSSYGHPVPRVGGRLQVVGRQAAAKVVKTDFTDAKDTVVLDLRKAYDCPTLVTLTRTFVFDRRALTVAITDKVRFSEPTEFESPVMTLKPHLLEGRLALTATGGEWEEKRETIENPGKPTPHRIAVRFKEPVAEASVSFVFSCGK